MEKIIYEDIYKFHFVSDPVLSPDGNHALFTRSYADKEKNGYGSEIWICDLKTKEVKPLTKGGEERSAYWLDENTVAFICRRPVDGKKAGGTVWYKIDIRGGEAVFYRNIPQKTGSITELMAKDYVITETVDSEKDLDLGPAGVHVERTEEEKKYLAQEGKDFEVIDEFPWWMNGRRFINKKRNRIVLHRGGEDKVITPRYLDVSGMQVNKEKTMIVYTGCEYKDVLSRTSGMYLYDILKEETTCLIPQGTHSISGAFFMDNEIFFTSLADNKRGDNPDFCIYEMETGKVRTLPFPDCAPHGGVGCDCNYGGGRGMKYENGYLYFTRNSFSSSILVRMDRNGSIELVDGTPGSVNAFDIVNGRIIMSAQRDMKLTELYLLENGEETQLSFLNQEYLDTHEVIEPEYFTMKDRDGVMLEGYVMKPLGYEEGRKYPGILEMHGGPKVIFGKVFHHEMQCYAQQGYFVFYTNPRGSDGRGDAFAKINGLLGTIDYNDFMDFTDEVVRRYPGLDETKIGICGGSYGGYMCNWMIGQTDRFAAAASQRSISNYFTKELCTDIGITYDLPQAGGDPWNDFEQVWEISPLKYAPRAVTPTLFIQSDEDHRCWQSGAFQMFNALQQNGTPSKICLFHGETHELSRSGKPANRISRLKEMGDWFCQWLSPVENA